MTSLIQSFIAALDNDLRQEMEPLAELSEQLAGCMARGRAAWPTISVDEDAFGGWLARRISRDLPPDQRLAQLNAAGLYIACACADAGDVAAAKRALREAHRGDVERALSRIDAPQAELDDIEQIVWQKILVGDPPKPATIAQYSGRGQLRGWIRVSTVNTALNIVSRKRRDEIPVADEMLAAHPSEGDDPEITVLKIIYRAEFKRAFRQAWSELSARERTLLQLRFIENLTIDQLDAIYHVYRATVARWLAKARGRLMQLTRDALTDRLGLDHDEFDSLMRLIDSNLGISMRSLVG